MQQIIDDMNAATSRQELNRAKPVFMAITNKEERLTLMRVYHQRSLAIRRNLQAF